MLEGWIKLHRIIQNSDLYPYDRPFTEFEAWIDLLLNALYEDEIVKINGIRIKGKRGQVIDSLRNLERKWHWSNTKVKNFLDFLKDKKDITYKTQKKTSTITIVNWDKYQDQNTIETSQKHHKNITLLIEEGKEVKELTNIVDFSKNKEKTDFVSLMDLSEYKNINPNRKFELSKLYDQLKSEFKDLDLIKIAGKFCTADLKGIKNHKSYIRGICQNLKQEQPVYMQDFPFDSY